MYKLNLRGYMLGTLGRALVVVAGYLGSVPLMLLFTGIAAFGQGPWQGDMNAVIASCSEYTYLKQGNGGRNHVLLHLLGVKLGGGLGTAIAGWMLAASGFDKNLTCMQMLSIGILYADALFYVSVDSIDYHSGDYPGAFQDECGRSQCEIEGAAKGAGGRYLLD